MNAVPPGEDLALNASGKSSPDAVLIAEDDPIFRRILQSWLQKWNYRVTVVENGVGCLARAATRGLPPDGNPGLDHARFGWY